MAPQKMTLKYALSGTKPPLYVAGSFSNPAWQPQEMQYTVREDEYEFHKEIQVEAGHEYQYKYRVGPGDWWVLNEQSPTVTDDVGNRNNLLIVPKQPEPFLELTEPPTNESSIFVKMDIPESHGADGAASPLPTDTTLPIRELAGNTKENEVEVAKPILVVEKVDSAPSYGDDFWPEATVGQKGAHKLQAEDAEPDYVVVRGDTNTPDLANVAAEVADLAATLDRDEPTPSISDDEAGRIGLRRMSNTPIHDVADTAAEVADVAAKLDKDAFKIEMPSPPSMADFEDDTSSGAPTPWDERVPRFPHECISPPNEAELQEPVKQPAKYTPRESPSPYREYDPNDPNIEEFPVDRAGILAKLRETQRNLPEDQTRDDIVPPSPNIIGLYRPERAELSPNMFARSEEHAGSLDSIPEDDYREELLASESTKSADTEVFESNGDGTEDKERKPSVDVHEVAAESPTFVEERIALASIELPPTPFAADSQQDNTDKVSPESGPSIIVSPATPGSSEFKSKPIDTAKATAIEAENGRAQLTSRRQAQDQSTSTDTTEPESIVKQVSPDHERSVTPISVRATPKEAKSKNFLTNFFKLVFIDWIGGFIAKLCAGHRNVLMAIAALVLITITYFSV